MFSLQAIPKSLIQVYSFIGILSTRIFENTAFKSNVRETWRVILVSEADIFLSESLRILAERLSQSEIGLPLRQICYYSPPEDVGVFSTEINSFRHRNFSFILLSIPIYFSHNNVKNVRNLTCILSKTLLVH